MQQQTLSIKRNTTQHEHVEYDAEMKNNKKHIETQHI